VPSDAKSSDKALVEWFDNASTSAAIASLTSAVKADNVGDKVRQLLEVYKCTNKLLLITLFYLRLSFFVI